MSEQQFPLEVYQFHLLLLQISPAIWRRFLIRSDASIADLHYAIQIGMGWEDAHLHRFRIHGKEYGQARLSGLWFSDDPKQVQLHTLRLRCKERFIYEYNLSDLWQHQLRLEQVLPFDPAATYPYCLGGSWQAPPEDCGGPSACLARRQHAPAQLTHYLSEALQEPGADTDDYRGVLQDLSYWLTAHKFNRRAINQQLLQYATSGEYWHPDRSLRFPHKWKASGRGVD